MPLTALALVIAAALMHAVWNLAAKRGEDAVVFAFLTAAAATVLWAPVNLWLLVTMPSLTALSWGVTAWVLVMASAAIHGMYFVVLLQGYRLAPLSVVYPVARGTGPLFAAFAAVALFHENLSLASTGGILLIGAGVLLISWNINESITDQASLSKGLIWGAGTGLTIALYTLVDAYAVKYAAIYPVSFDYLVGSLRGLMMLPFVLAKRDEVVPVWRRQRRSLLTVACLAPAGFILVLFAMQLAPLSRVAPAREISIMFGTFLGGKLLKEGHVLCRTTAAAMIALGVILLGAA